MTLEEQLQHLPEVKKVIILTPSVLLADAKAALGQYSFTKKDSSTLLLYGDGVIDPILSAAYRSEKNPHLQEAADMFYDTLFSIQNLTENGLHTIINEPAKKKYIKFLSIPDCKTAEERVTAIKQMCAAVQKTLRGADVEVISLDKSELLQIKREGMAADTWQEVSVNSYDNLPAGWTILKKEDDFLNWRLDHNTTKLVIDESDQRTLDKNTDVITSPSYVKKLDQLIASIDPTKEINNVNPELVQDLLERQLRVNSFILIPNKDEMIVLYHGIDRKGNCFMRTPVWKQYLRQTFIKETENLRGAKPRNVFQVMYVELLLNDLDMVVGFGPAGTGKSFLPLAYMLDAIERPIKPHLNKQIKRSMLKQEGIVLYPLSAVEEDIGYLPGGVDEKTGPYQQAILANLSKLIPNKTGLDDLLGIKNKDGIAHKTGNAKLSLIPANYLRGTTYDDVAFLVDEAQNFSYNTLKTIVTRMGENTLLVIDADPWQADRHVVRGYNGFIRFIKAVFDNKRIVQDKRMAALYLPKFANERSEFSRRIQDYLI
ncbi:MAG: PhoH family protein [archaeon]